jgi:hypothetical protein
MQVVSGGLDKQEKGKRRKDLIDARQGLFPVGGESMSMERTRLGE